MKLTRIAILVGGIAIGALLVFWGLYVSSPPAVIPAAPIVSTSVIRAQSGGSGITLSLLNSGTASTYLTGAGDLTFGGIVQSLSCPPNTVLDTGTKVAVTCSVNLTGTTAGKAFTGSIQLGNGGTAYFSGNFS